MAEHGSIRYRAGCRCDVCREGNRVYTRDRRAVAREARLAAEAEGRVHIVEGITRGLAGYRDKSCRCLACRVPNAESTTRYRARKKGAA